MTPNQMWVSFYTMLRKDIVRMFRIWVQTFLPSVITAVLYFSVFGAILGSRIGEMQGVDYMSFVVPGLVMLAIVTTSYAKTIDGINIVPTFVLTPLVYLGGIFYSVHVLQEWWQTITYSNPLFYLVNGFRYGFLGITDVALSISLLVLVAMTVVLIAINWYFIKTGLGLRQ